MSGFTPVNQVRLTNVAYVRLTKHSKKFEIACYRNKVLNWRNKIETDLGEVLQIDNIFTNVSKGTLASSKDLLDVFGTTDKHAICIEILEKGEMQVTEKERAAQHEIMFRDIAQIVVEKSINPETNRPYTASIVQNAMKEIHYSINTSKTAKQQALDVIRRLKAVMPIIRADMSVRIVCKSGREFEEIQLRFESDLKVAVTSAPQLSSTKDVVYFDLSIEPDKFKRMEQLVHDITLGSGRVEVLQLKSTATLTKDEGVVKDMDALELESMNVTTESAETSPREKVERLVSVPEAAPTISGPKCSTCGCSFETTELHRSHFKSKWHTHNLKLKMKSLSVVKSLEEFEALTPAQIKLAETEY